MIREWIVSLKFCTQEDIDKARKKPQKRVHKSTIKGLDDHLRQWLIKKRKDKICVTFKAIKDEAKSFVGNHSFSASPGWWQRCRRRLKVTFRVPTHIVQKLLETSSEDIKKYLMRLQIIKMETPSKIQLIWGNFDETPIQFDMATGRTYDFIGKKEVIIQTTRGLKMRFTALLTILSSGVFLPPLVIFKNKKALPAELIKTFGNKCLLFSNTKGYITDNILITWFERVWLNYNFPNNHKPIIILDKCKAHLSTKMINFLTVKKVAYEIISSGTTGYQQPLDVSVNKPSPYSKQVQ